jgi:hypothetical protein
MREVTSQRRHRAPTEQEEVVAIVNDAPALAALHRFLVRLAIRRLNQRKETTHIHLVGAYTGHELEGDRRVRWHFGYDAREQLRSLRLRSRPRAAHTYGRYSAGRG